MPRTRELLQQYCCIQQAVQQFLFFRVHTLSEGARPTQGLIADSRMRRRDMARSFDSGEGSCKRLGTASLDADDSQFCSAAVTGEDVRIGLEIGS